ncbi:Protein smoothened [Ooceraea biroi]|uniref:Protein smoothened n=1 Tax=Ooceraea biroi TaxID=2015173 RepID=A0A026VTV1_OOCBI|nr:Protein smoothened [Ooceraea biroi]
MRLLLWTVCLIGLLLHGCYTSSLELEDRFTTNSNCETTTWKSIELTHKESKYLLNYPIGELSPDASLCRRPAKCIPLDKDSYCMSAKLPYSSTTLDLIPGGVTQDVIKDKLHQLQTLKHVPKCWAVVQPFLCSIFMPKCVNDTVALPSREMCKMISGPCRLLLNHTIWPSFIRCDNAELFPQSCKSNVRELKFNTSGECLKPLVPTDNALSIFDGVEGCGTQCYDPLYTFDEHTQLHSFIVWCAGICCAFNFLAVVTFLIDWRNACKYPALVIFYINGCFMVSCIGWLAQFVASRDAIICRKDGTLRTKEPGGQNLSCVITFALVYYFLMAAMIWFVILTYAWHRSCRVLGKIKDRIDKKSASFHLIAWCLPLILTVMIMGLGEIDGNSVMGICFVGYTNHVVRAAFVLGPIVLGALIGGCFLCRGLYMLICFKISCREIISNKLSSKIKHILIRMGVFSSLIIAAVVVTVYCHVCEMIYSWQWKQSFRDYMICKITTKYSDMSESECKMSVRPSTGKLQLHLFALFSTGIIMSSWVWTSSTVDAWLRFLKRAFTHEVEDPVRLSKHKLIARLFANRKTFNRAGRLSLSFRNSHEDPVGLDFDLNSEATRDISSTWAAALPNLVTRRCALVGGVTASVSSNRRNSLDSEINSYKCVSRESRRNSLDSQISVQISQMMKTVTVVPCWPRIRYGKNRPEFLRSNKCDSPPRRDSITSQDSQLVTQPSAIEVHNMGRRPGNAGLEERDLDSRNNNETQSMLMRFLLSQGEHSGSVENAEAIVEENQYVPDKNVDEMDKMEKGDESDADSENSRLEEKVKTPDFEEVNECSRNKSNKDNKNYRAYVHENNRRNRKSNRRSKYTLQQDAASQHLLQENDNLKAKSEKEKGAYRRTPIAMRDSSSSVSSSSLELSRLLRNDEQPKAREIATQTSPLPLDMLEMEELKQSIDDIINSRNSKGTQISPRFKSKHIT